MATPRPRWPLILAGVAVFVVVVVIALGVAGTLFLRDNVHVAGGTSRDDADLAFEEAKRPFADQRPILVVGDDDRPVFAPDLEARRHPGGVTSLHVLAWGADDGALATVTLPMWLLRLKSGPIVFGEYVSGMDDRVRLDPKDLDRYGPGIVFEFESPDGDRVLLTAH